ncbi:MAG TPA: hypothetical protein VIV63_02790 [Steroidobacteraceae bacterium]
MQTLIRAAVVIAVAGTLFACKPKPEAKPVAEAEATDDSEAGPGENLLEACVITMTEPELVRWTTYWDAAAGVNNTESESIARSEFWANDEEKKSLSRSSSAAPLTIQCSSNDEPSIAVSFSSYSSTMNDIPLGSGEYAIVSSSGGDPQPGQFQAGPVLYDQRTIAVTGGTLTIDRFDMEGVRGAFRVDGKADGEDGEEGQEYRFEGTFEIPCRGGSMESACESNKAQTN